MSEFKKKLNSKDGVTILIALVGFMVAAMISVVIVTAAVTSAQRVANDRKTNQAHLSLESAVQIVRNGMEGTTGIDPTVYKFDKYTDIGKIDVDTALVTGTFADEIKNAVEFVDEYTSAYSSEDKGTSFQITVNDADANTIDAVSPVKVSFVMNREGADDKYEIIFTLSQDNTEDEIYLTMHGNCVQKDDDTYCISWNMVSITEKGD